MTSKFTMVDCPQGPFLQNMKPVFDSYTSTAPCSNSIFLSQLPNETCSHKMRDKSQNFISKLLPYSIHLVQTLSFKMIYYMSGLLLHFGSKIYHFLEKFLCFLLISDMFSEPYLLYFPGDLSLILWEQVSFFRDLMFMVFITRARII